MMIEKAKTIFNVENLSVGYLKKKNRIEIANQINFELSQGELIGLVGANGIGKSTLLRTLTRVQPTLAGNIYLNEKAIETITNLEFAKAMSIVLTEGPVSNNLSVSELIALGTPKELMSKYNAKNLEEVFMKITGRRIMEGV